MTRARLLFTLGLLGLVTFSAGAVAQERRVASPAGRSATQVGGRHDVRVGYVGGKWIEVRYGRPIKRGRDLFGPDDHREFLNDGAPVWRAGANVSTRLLTEVPLVFGTTTVAPGEYSVFIDLQPTDWGLRHLGLAGAVHLRLREPRGAVRRVRVHTGQGCGPGTDDGRDVTAFVRPALVAVPGHDRQRRHTGIALGQEARFGGVRRRAGSVGHVRVQSVGKVPGRTGTDRPTSTRGAGLQPRDARRVRRSGPLVDGVL